MGQTFGRNGLACAAAGVIALQASAGIVINPVVVEGDMVAGVGTVTLINNIAINNSGSWLVEVDTDFANTDQDAALLNPAGLLFQEGFGGLSGPMGAVIDSFDSVTLNNNGDGGFNFFIDPFPTGEDSGVYFNGTLVIQESFISTAPQFSANTPYIGFFDVKVNDNDQLMIIASIDDPAITSTVDRAIVIVDAMTGVETVVAKEGDVLPGQVEAVADFGTGPHQSAINNNGDVLFFADLAGDTAADGVIYLDNALLAQEGSASVVAGRNYELLSSRSLDLNNNGDFVFKANLDGDAANDEVIIANGAVFAQEGDAPPMVAGFALTSFGTGSGSLQIADNGSVLWFGDWDDPDTDIDTGLFLDSTMLIQEGVSTVGGVVIDTINSGDDAFFISDNGQWVIFEATLINGVNGAFAIQLGVPGDLNGDGLVDGTDLAELLAQWGGPGSADLNGDGVVDGADLATLLANWT